MTIAIVALATMSTTRIRPRGRGVGLARRPLGDLSNSFMASPNHATVTTIATTNSVGQFRLARVMAAVVMPPMTPTRAAAATLPQHGCRRVSVLPSRVFFMQPTGTFPPVPLQACCCAPGIWAGGAGGFALCHLPKTKPPVGRHYRIAATFCQG